MSEVQQKDVIRAVSASPKAKGSPNGSPKSLFCDSTTSGEPKDASPTADTGPKKYDGLTEDECTTLMVRNIPNKYSQRMVLGVIEKHGFKGTFDFLYVPSDFSTRVNVGYCFVNFIEPKWAQEFARVFHRMHLSGFKSKKLVQISLGTTQGFSPNIKKFEDSTLCSEFVAPEFHPLIFDTKTGEEIPFRSLMPGYEPLPPSRLADPDFWVGKDDEKQWEGDTLYPTVLDARPKTTQSAQVSRQNTLERQNTPPAAGKKNTNNKKGGKGSKGSAGKGILSPRGKGGSPGTTPRSGGKGKGGKSKGGKSPSASTLRADAAAFDPLDNAMSPRSRALHAQRYSTRAQSFGAPPGFGQPRYSRTHGYDGYPLPTAELFDMYTEMGPSYSMPRGSRRASIGAPPGLSRGSGLTPDFTEFVTRLERGIEYDMALASLAAERQALAAAAARSPAAWRSPRSKY